MLSNSCFADEIAITMDDLPSSQDEKAEEQQEINEKILKALAKHKAPAVGFVNEYKLYEKGQTVEKSLILKMWVDHKQPLGNHTFSHPFLSQTKLEDFKKDVIKGAAVSKKLMDDAGMKYCYFRHPYLDTGENKDHRHEFEKFLKEQGYIIAPVTVDTDDWKFNQQLLQNPKDKDNIIKSYLEHTRAKFAFYKSASIKMFGRNIKHIWLLHVNLINAYAMDDLLKLAKEMGYDFITLDRALEDKAYQEPDEYYAQAGCSWLFRWDFTRGKVIDWSKETEPDNSPFIERKSIELFDGALHRKVPVYIYVNEELKGKAKAGIAKLPVVIITHGHGLKNTQYSFLANALANQGYFVASIQHELDGDAFPTSGNVYEKRKPLWELGVTSILFAIAELKRIEPNLDFEKITLIGHSHGGDIAMMFAANHPEIVSRVISLDSLRMPFPNNKVAKLTIRANDKKADDGVIPESGTKVVCLNIKHNDMCDKGSDAVKQQILAEIVKFFESAA